MCGIAGILGVGAGYRVDPSELRRMCDVIRHRGPDDDGYHVEQPVGLGMRRLSIIDLAGGHQPMSNEERDGLGRLQRRDLQLPGAARRAGSPGPPLPEPQRHRGHRPRLRAVGRGVRQAPARDVRDRPLGRPREEARAGARLGRHQAAALVPGRGEARVRLGDQVDPRLPGRVARDRPRRARPLPDLRVHPGALLDLPPDQQAAAGPPARLAARRRRPSAPTGISRSRPSRTGRSRVERGGVRARTAGAAARVRAAPDGQRRAARGVPERRHRLQLRRRPDERVLGPPREDLLDRLQGAVLRRAGVRPAGRRSGSARSTTSSC